MILNINYPLHIDGRGRVAEADVEKHVRQLIEQVLFTGPGERVNRPTFGAEIQQLLFAPNDPDLMAFAQLTVQGALEQWLSDVIRVDAVAIETEDSSLLITVRYFILSLRLPATATFTRKV